MTRNQDSSLHQLDKKSLLFAAALHFGLITLLILKNLIYPENTTRFDASLRVDLVGLPDLNQTTIAAPKPLPKETVKEPDQSLEEPKDDEGIAPRPQAKKNKTAEKPNNSRDKKMNTALAKLRALERIRGTKNEEGDTIKGNILSKGSSLSPEAKLSLEKSYYDDVKERVSSVFSIPGWLAQQNHTAQVKITISERGEILSSQFIKYSGIQAFDEEVKRALLDANPLPTPPEALKQHLKTKGILLGFPL